MKKMSSGEICEKLRAITMSKKDFLKGAKKFHLFRKVSDDAIFIDESDAKINKDWSILANQSVTNPTY